jgi:hypothetical protein
MNSNLKMLKCPSSRVTGYDNAIDVIKLLPELEKKITPVMFGTKAINHYIPTSKMSINYNLIMTPKQIIKWLSVGNGTNANFRCYDQSVQLTILEMEGSNHYKLVLIASAFRINIFIATHINQGISKAAIKCNNSKIKSIKEKILLKVSELKVVIPPPSLLLIFKLIGLKYIYENNMGPHLEDYSLLQKYIYGNTKPSSSRVLPAVKLYESVRTILTKEADTMYHKLYVLPEGKEATVESLIDISITAAIHMKNTIDYSYPRMVCLLSKCRESEVFINKHVQLKQLPKNLHQKYEVVLKQLQDPSEVYFRDDEVKLAKRDLSTMLSDSNDSTSAVCIQIDAETYHFKCTCVSMNGDHTITIILNHNNRTTHICVVRICGDSSIEVQAKYIQLSHDIVYLLRLAFCYLKIKPGVLFFLNKLSQNSFSRMLPKCKHHPLTKLYVRNISKKNLTSSIQLSKRRFLAPLIPVSFSHDKLLSEITRYHKYDYDIMYNLTVGPISKPKIEGDLIHHYFYDNEIQEAHFHNRNLRLTEGGLCAILSIANETYIIKVKIGSYSIELYCNDIIIHTIRYDKNNEGYMYIKELSSLPYPDMNPYVLPLALMNLKIEEVMSAELHSAIDYFLKKGISTEYFIQYFYHLKPEKCHHLMLTYQLGLLKKTRSINMLD